jgi:serine/threonine-protein kinase
MAGVQEVLAERYELLELLGRGGMGVVYRARDRVLDRVVAVKVLPFDRAQDPVSVARFEREALAVAALSHRNIVAVFDAGTDGATRFIVMEYLAGRSLAERLRDRGALDTAQAVDVAAQVASALAAAHRAGIVHRDIKPANVMLDEHGHVKVLDFGIARLAAGLSLTQTAMVVGSAQYLAPELCRGAAADARSDIYALGCVLYALLTGQPPFTGELPAAVVHQQLSAAPRAPVEFDPAMPAALSALTLAMLAKEPEERPQDAQELVTALPATLANRAARGAAGSQDAEATRVMPLPSAGLDAADATREMTEPTRVVTEPTRVMPGPTRVMPWPTRGVPADPGPHRRLALAAIAAATLAVAVIALLALTGGSGPSRARAAKHSSTTASNRAASTRPATTSSTSTSAATDTATTDTATTSTSADGVSTPQTAIVALSTLLENDAQAGTVAAPAAHAIVADAQQITAAAESGQGAAALAGFMKLGTDISGFAQHGQINASAIPALDAAVSTLGAVLEQSAVGTTPAAQTVAGPGQQPGAGRHHGGPGGGLPPGEAKKLGK